MRVECNGYTYDVQEKAKRGDVLLVHWPLIIDILDQGRESPDCYRFGIVAQVNRYGLATRLIVGDYAMTVPDGRRSWLIPADQIDVDAFLVWLGLADNGGIFETYDEAREMAERFRR